MVGGDEDRRGGGEEVRRGGGEEGRRVGGERLTRPQHTEVILPSVARSRARAKEDTARRTAAVGAGVDEEEGIVRSWELGNHCVLRKAGEQLLERQSAARAVAHRRLLAWRRQPTLTALRPAERAVGLLAEPSLDAAGVEGVQRRAREGLHLFRVAKVLHADGALHGLAHRWQRAVVCVGREQRGVGGGGGDGGSRGQREQQANEIVLFEAGGVVEAVSEDESLEL